MVSCRACFRASLFLLTAWFRSDTWRDRGHILAIWANMRRKLLKIKIHHLVPPLTCTTPRPRRCSWQRCPHTELWCPSAPPSSPAWTCPSGSAPGSPASVPGALGSPAGGRQKEVRWDGVNRRRISSALWWFEYPRASTTEVFWQVQLRFRWLSLTLVGFETTWKLNVFKFPCKVGYFF